MNYLIEVFDFKVSKSIKKFPETSKLTVMHLKPFKSRFKLMLITEPLFENELLLCAKKGAFFGK